MVKGVIPPTHSVLLSLGVYLRSVPPIPYDPRNPNLGSVGSRGRRADGWVGRVCEGCDKDP